MWAVEPGVCPVEHGPQSAECEAQAAGCEV